MGTFRATYGAVLGPTYGATANGLPWEDGGGRPSVAPPSAPTISGAPSIGGTLTITAGAGGPTTSYTLYRDGVSAGTVVSGYTYVAADVGPALTVKAVGPGGTSADSNALSYAIPTTNLVADYNFESASYYTLVSGLISAALDQSGAVHNITQAVAGRRAVIAAAATPSGKDAADFAANGASFTSLQNADIGITSAVVSIVCAFTQPATGKTILDGFVGGRHQLFTDTPSVSLKMYTGAIGPIVALTPGTWYGGSFVFNGASSFLRIGQAAIVSADAGSNSDTGLVLGSSSGGGISAAKFARCLIYNAALTQAQTLDLNAYLSFRYGV